MTTTGTEESGISTLLTYFAPPERATPGELAADGKKLRGELLLGQMLDSFPEPAAILNGHRQIVLANDKLLHLLHVNPEDLVGERPGEALDCIHAWDCAGGCGTSRFCRDCGAVRAILDSGNSRTTQIQECRITCATEQGSAALDLRVWATPLAHCGDFTVFAVRDISDEKRRSVLERVFFHDMLNSLEGLQGIFELLPDLDPAEAAEIAGAGRHLIGEVVEAVRSQRDLAAAERGELTPKFTAVDVGSLLIRLCADYSRHIVAAGKTLAPPMVAGNPTIQSDESLLARVLGNLIKNALEASDRGQTVRVSFRNNGPLEFSVHNPSTMPDYVQRQIFQRSFSTKTGAGHGLGTYSVKLLTERYLGGTISFSSSAEQGTTFTVRLPSEPHASGR